MAEVRWWDSKDGGVGVLASVNPQLAAVNWTNPSWGAFMTSYNMTSFPTGADPALAESAQYTRTITAPFTGEYRLAAAADNSGSAEILSSLNVVLAQTSAAGFGSAGGNSCTYNFDKGEIFKIRLAYENFYNGSPFSGNPGAGAFALFGPDVEPAPPLPTVTLTASSTNVTVGDAVTLTWGTSGLDIDDLGFFTWTLQPYSEPSGREGFDSVTVNSTTTYYFTVTRLSDFTTNQAQVTVTANQPAADLELYINDDGVQKTSLTIQQGDLVTLQWSADDIVDGTLTLSANNGQKGINGEADNPGGPTSFSPKSKASAYTLTYTLGAKGLNGVNATATVTVSVPAKAAGVTNPPAGGSSSTTYPPQPNAASDPVSPSSPVFPNTGLIDAYGVLRIGLLNTDDATPDTFQVEGAEDTFSVGRYRTDGWDETTSFVEPTFEGTVKFEVGGNDNEGTSMAFTYGVPPHSHYVLGTEASGFSFFAAGKSGGTPAGTSFTDDARNAALENDPQPISPYNRNNDSLRSHSHHLSFGPVSGIARLGNDNKSGNYGGLNDGSDLNPGEGYWNTTDDGAGPFKNEIDQSTNYNIGKKLEKVIDVSNDMGVTPNIGNIVMTNRSRIAFDESLKIYLQSGEGINMIGDYTRTKYIIKAYVANNNVDF